MADFVAVLKKTIDGLGETTPDVRARVYDNADTRLRGMDAPAQNDKGDVFAANEDPATDPFQRLRPAVRKRSHGGLIAAVIALLVIAGGGYGVWLNKSAFANMFGSGRTET